MSSNVKTGVWVTSQLYEKINAGFLTYSADDSPPAEPGVTGTLFFTGFNAHGSGGNNQAHFTGQSSPIQIPGTQWTKFDVRQAGTLALKCDNTLWGWGQNQYGQIGNNTTTSYSSPVQIPGTSWSCVAGGPYRSVALKTDGTLWSWGFAGLVGNFNFEGNKIGDNTYNIPRSSPVQIPGTAWCHIVAGSRATFAMKTDGTIWGWGDGAAADAILSPNVPGTVPRFSSPVQLCGTNWVELSGAYDAMIARKTNGTIWTWGRSNFGQYGTNYRGNYSNQVQNQVPGTAWVQVGGAPSSPMARKSDNTLWVWGMNYTGQLGTSETATAHKSSPVQIPGTAWCCIHNTPAQHARRRVVKKTDGSSWGWGCNNYGSLLACGGSSTDFSSPVQIPGTIYCIGLGPYSTTQRR